MSINENLFNNDQGLRIVESLKRFGNTVIKYSQWREEGEEKILQDIKEISGLNCSLQVHFDGHAPMDWVEEYRDSETQKSYRLHTPVMPTVVVTVKKEKKG